MKLLTLNMHKGFGVGNRRFILHELREAIRAVEADVVCLQEVLGDHREHSTRYEAWPDGPQYEFLADTIWRHHAYGKNAAYPAGHHGNALLSKQPILEWSNQDVSTRKAERRGLLHCRLRSPGPDMADWHVICTHLGLTGGQRRAQLQMLSQRINQHVPADAPLVVAGDFNDWREVAHDMLAQSCGLQEVFINAYGRAARSFPVRFPLLRLDRVYTRNLHAQVPQVLHGRPWSHLSDHAGLLVELGP